MSYYDKRFISDGERPETPAQKRMEKYDEEFPGESMERPWKDGELLRSLYVDEQLSMNQIRKGWDCSIATICKWIEEHGIEKRTPSETQQNIYGTLNKASFYTHPRGYERWRTGEDTIEHHRLLAVLKYDIEAVCQNDVHHKNNIPWDNRLENIELVDPEKHQSHHRKVSGIDRIRLAELYENGDIGSRDIGDMFGVAGTTVLHIHDEFFGEVS
jgi:hypothetical protein